MKINKTNLGIDLITVGGITILSVLWASVTFPHVEALIGATIAGILLAIIGLEIFINDMIKKEKKRFNHIMNRDKYY